MLYHGKFLRFATHQQDNKNQANDIIILLHKHDPVSVK